MQTGISYSLVFQGWDLADLLYQQGENHLSSPGDGLALGYRCGQNKGIENPNLEKPKVPQDQKFA